MADLRLKCDSGIQITGVPNTFIDEYMPKANGEYVKVYLMLLKMFTAYEEDVSLSKMADALEHTEKDIMRALCYWEREGLLDLKHSGKNSINEICLLPVHKPKDIKNVSKESPVKVMASAESVTASGRDSLRRLEKNEEFAGIMYMAEQYLNKTLTSNDCDMLVYLYDELGFSSEVIEYLIEYCVINGKKSRRYIETVALDWHSRGLKSLSMIKEGTSAYSKNTFEIMKTFGLQNRGPAVPEKRLINKWLEEEHYSMDLIIEACSRTIRSIHQPSFEYADKILSDWKNNKIKNISEIKKLDEHKSANREKPLRGAAPKTVFQDFDQRTYDYDALMQQLKQ